MHNRLKASLFSAMLCISLAVPVPCYAGNKDIEIGAGGSATLTAHGRSGNVTGGNSNRNNNNSRGSGGSGGSGGSSYVDTRPEWQKKADAQAESGISGLNATLDQITNRMAQMSRQGKSIIGKTTEVSVSSESITSEEARKLLENANKFQQALGQTFKDGDADMKQDIRRIINGYNQVMNGGNNPSGFSSGTGDGLSTPGGSGSTSSSGGQSGKTSGKQSGKSSNSNGSSGNGSGSGSGGYTEEEMRKINSGENHAGSWYNSIGWGSNPTGSSPGMGQISSVWPKDVLDKIQRESEAEYEKLRDEITKGGSFSGTKWSDSKSEENKAGDRRSRASVKLKSTSEDGIPSLFLSNSRPDLTYGMDKTMEGIISGGAYMPSSYTELMGSIASRLDPHNLDATGKITYMKVKEASDITEKVSVADFTSDEREWAIYAGAGTSGEPLEHLMTNNPRHDLLFGNRPAGVYTITARQKARTTHSLIKHIKVYEFLLMDGQIIYKREATGGGGSGSEVLEKITVDEWVPVEPTYQVTIDGNGNEQDNNDYNAYTQRVK